MIFRNPFNTLDKFEWCLWICSLIVVGGAFLIAGSFYPLTLVTSLIGVTALIFVAKGDVWGQILTVIFSLFYAGVSFKFRYYGEMITYLGMTAPIALLSVVSWMRNRYAGTTEVRVNQITRMQGLWIGLFTVVVTILFYFILDAFGTTNLYVSTLSIATSFLAAILMLFRCPGYALAFAANDIVLIILWILATIDELSYMPMIACFTMFLLNDLYGFLNWKRMKQRQRV